MQHDQRKWIGGIERLRPRLVGEPGSFLHTPCAQVLEYFQTFTSDDLGQIALTPILDISGYGIVSLEIGAGVRNKPHKTVRVLVNMGKISGTTFSEFVDRFTIDPLNTRAFARIHTYDVIGPELAVWIVGAPPNKKVDVQAWVFLH